VGHEQTKDEFHVEIEIFCNENV